jgi:DNA-binding transcriptional LysR family regulator
MLARFMVQYPLVELHVQSTNRQVDLIQEGIDIALRVRFPPLESSDLVMKVLGESRQRVVGAPALRERLPKRPTPADVAALPTLHWGVVQREYHWQLDGPKGASAQVRYQPRMVTDDLVALRQAALAGAGAVHMPAVVVCEDLNDGKLVNLLPDWAPRTGVVHAVFPSRRGLLPSVRTLLDFLGEEFEKSDMS